MLKKNVGTVDRAVRIVVGVALLSMLFLVQGPWSYAGLIGLVPLLTAALGTCPLYTLLGIGTCPVDTGRPRHA
jgi:hypothetical protein